MVVSGEPWFGLPWPSVGSIVFWSLCLLVCVKVGSILVGAGCLSGVYCLLGLSLVACVSSLGCHYLWWCICVQYVQAE